MKQSHKAAGRWLSGILAVTLTALLSSGWMASATAGYTNRCLILVTEPGNSSSTMEYYVGDEKKSVDDMVWDNNGHSGTAVSLSGAGEYLKIGYPQLQMHTMTFTGWFLWRGEATGQKEESMYTQRLFTLSRNDNTWLTVMPHAKDATRPDKDGKIIDGVYMGFSMGDSTDQVKYEFWNPAVPGRESYGLPLNEWHHVAMTMDGQSLKLYIDGRLWFQRMLILGAEEMRNNSLTIGSGRWGDPTLNALVDDMAVYDFAMTADQIAMLHANVNPLAEGASLPATTAPILPQKPTSTTAVTTTASHNTGGELLGLPVWIVWMVGGMLAVVGVLSAVLSVVRPAQPRQDDSGSPPDKWDDGGKGDDLP